MSTEERVTIIALPTTQVPALAEPEKNLVAVCVLTPVLASDILSQMRTITELAEQNVGMFKLSSFYSNTFYVPAHLVGTPPPADDFLVLEPAFTTPVVAQLVRTQIGIIPGAVIFEAFDAENRFQVSTIELGSEVLEAISRGVTFNPGDTSKAMKVVVPVGPVQDEDPKWTERLM